MKNLLTIFSLCFLMLFSCSSDNDDNNSNSPNPNNPTLLKKLIGSNGDYNEFIYNGNKLFRVIYQNGSYFEFIYTGEFVSSVISYNGNNQLGSYSETYEHQNGKLISRKAYSNNELVESDEFTYLPNNVRKMTDLMENNNGIDTYLYFDTNQNYIKEESYNNNSQIYIKEFSYDNKYNPLKNIIGLNTEMRYIDWIYTTNNIISFTGYASSQTISYQYNDENFPTLATIYNNNDNSEETYTFQY